MNIHKVYTQSDVFVKFDSDLSKCIPKLFGIAKITSLNRIFNYSVATLIYTYIYITRVGLVNRFKATVTIGLHTTVNGLTATETQNKIYRYLLLLKKNI